MKFVVAPDSFKGTLTAKEAAEIMAERIKARFPLAETVVMPIADGGEGTAECFAAALGGTMVKEEITYPDLSRGEASFAMLQGNIAVIDMAAAAGIGLTAGRIAAEKATTFGLGELISKAAGRGAKRIVVGLGGSGTHDCGCGCAAALGAVFRDSSGKAFIPVGATLKDVCDVDLSALSLPGNTKVEALCDVDNPPFGENGAAFVFAPQKGADEKTCRALDDGTRRLCGVIRKRLGRDVSDMRSGGAAGGTGLGLAAFVGAELKRGVDAVLDAVGFDGAVCGADLVFTGEGRTDGQTLHGKAVAGAARRAAALGVRTVAVSGYFDGDPETERALKALGVMRIFSVTDGLSDLETLKATAADDLRRAMDEVLSQI